MINNPGPGTYENNPPKNTAFSIGKSKSLSNLQDTPGVGRYNAQLTAR